MPQSTNPAVRHDIVWLFDITDGNPNGDPDASNRPRVDDETGHGLMTDVSLKRKIRDTLPLAAKAELADNAIGYELFVKAGVALNTKLEESYNATGTSLAKDTRDAPAARQWLCKKYCDVRLFGAVLSSGRTLGLKQIRGPLQVSFARTFDPVAPVEHTITRQVHTTEKDAEKAGGTMGNKWTIPYGLFQATLSYSAIRGDETGVSQQDFVFLYKSLQTLFDHTSSAARQQMATRGLYVFSHADAFGNAPMHQLMDKVQVSKSEGVQIPRSFSDYVVHLDDSTLPTEVTVDRLV